MKNEDRAIAGGEPAPTRVEMAPKNIFFAHPVVGEEAVGCLRVGPVLASQRDALAEPGFHLLHQLAKAAVQPTVAKPAAGKFLVKPPIADSHQSSRRFSINVATDSHQSSHPILSMVATPERSDAITLLSAVLLSRFPRQRYHRRRPCCKVEGHGVRAARAPHESERRARTMLSHHPSRFSDAPERSDDSTARSAAPCRDHALVPAPASSLRMDLPRSSMRMAPWTRRSRMASARVASLSCRCQSATGN